MDIYIEGGTVTIGKIIFINVDVTLLNYENKLPVSADKAIKLVRQNGHKVYICTGRSKAEVYSYLWNIGLDGMIGGNGSYVEAHDHVVMHQVMTKEQGKHIVDWLKSRNLEFYLESNNGLFASENFETRGEPVIQEYSRKKGKDNSDKMTVREIFLEMISGGELYRDDLNCFILESYQDHLDSIEEFLDLKPGTWGGKGEVALFGDLGVKDITKANAIDHLLQYLGASIEDTIAFGDAKIDIPMLEYCKIGVAMGSGGDEIEAMADYVADDVDQDGLYNAFVHFGLIDKDA